MKSLLFILLSCFVSGLAYAEVIYAKTSTMALPTGCLQYTTTFWGDNNTSEPTDDRYLGSHVVVDCPGNGFTVPDFTILSPMEIKLTEDGNAISDNLPLVSFKKYKQKLEKLTALNKERSVKDEEQNE